MRKITMIVLHCDGLRPHQHNSVKKIDAYHKSKGWKGIGYHFWVNRQGEVFTGRRLEEVGAHVVGHNSHSIGICYEGGLDIRGKNLKLADFSVDSIRLGKPATHGRLSRFVPCGSWWNGCMLTFLRLSSLVIMT